MLYLGCFSCTRETLERMTVSVEVNKDEVEGLKAIMNHIYDSIRSKNNKKILLNVRKKLAFPTVWLYNSFALCVQGRRMGIRPGPQTKKF